jgi:dimethylargininase
MLRNEGNRLSRVIVCTPRYEYFCVSDPKAHNIAQVADREKAQQQHDRLKSVLAESGCEVIDVPELAGHPNSVFTRDTALCTPDGYVKLRLGLDTRLGEGEWMARALESLGVPRAREITPPGTVEGGDVVLAGNVAFVGRSTRTNADGIRQLSDTLHSMGYEMRVVSLPDEILHLDKVMMVVGPERIVCLPEFFPDGFFAGFDTIEIPRRGDNTANVICLGENEIIANTANAQVIEILEGEKVTVHSIDLSEFAKGMGGPNCLIMPVERK